MVLPAPIMTDALNPTQFHGAAGIECELLRLAEPKVVPSVCCEKVHGSGQRRPDLHDKRFRRLLSALSRPSQERGADPLPSDSNRFGPIFQNAHFTRCQCDAPNRNDLPWLFVAPAAVALADLAGLESDFGEREVVS
jgi:hypothetical protein